MTSTGVGAVVNPVSGDGRGRELLETLRECLGVEVDATVTGGPGEAPTVARSYRDCDLLVVVGGDGTVREVASGLIEGGRERPPLFVVPAGRGNSVYRHLYGDLDWRELARRLGRGLHARPLDLGRYETDDGEGGYFVLGFSAGLFRGAVEGAEAFGFLPGPLAYVLGTARAVLTNEPVEIRLEGAAGTLFEGRARLVAVGGGRYRASAFDLFPESRPADGDLHALVVEPTTVRETVAVTRAATAGRHSAHPAVHSFRSPRFHLSTPDGVPVEVDGTPLERPLRSVHLAVLPGGVTVAYPGETGSS